jgi:predicted nucleic acid-binding protein
MKDKIAFWDTSALVPLCCLDRHSSKARAFSRHYPRMVAWWGSRVEIRSALSRLFREKNLNAEEFQQALKLAARIINRYSVILPSEQLAELADDCLSRYPLRAADALQLSAALIWCRQKPIGRTLITFDPGLAEAAAMVGFDVPAA